MSPTPLPSEISPATFIRLAKTLCIVNNKGGRGKTHTCFHLAGALVAAGHRVLVVDLDAQANLTRLFLDQRTFNRITSRIRRASLSALAVIGASAK